MSQEKFTFSTDYVTFIEEVRNVMQHSDNKIVTKESRKMMPLLIEKWNGGRFNNVEKENIREITQKMFDENLTNDVIFINFFEVINIIAPSSLDHESLSNYLIYSNNLYKSKGLKTFRSSVSYSKSFFGENALNIAKSMTWLLRDAKIKIVSSEDFVVNVESATVVCKSKRDSIVINDTKGVFNKEKMTWCGRGGTSSWQKCKWEADKVYVELSNYSIDLKTESYTADSVVFHHKELLSVPAMGAFQDKCFSNAQNSKSKYPLFASYSGGYDVKGFYDAISLSGYVKMQGEEFHVFGDNESPTIMKFQKDDKSIAEIKARFFVNKDKKLRTNYAQMRISIADDSIVHNDIAMQYEDENRVFVFYNNTTSYPPFFDTYHKIYIYSDALFWDIDANTLKFNKMISTSSDSKAYLQSFNYFRYSEYDKIMALDSKNPLEYLWTYMGSFKTNIVEVDLFANYIGRNKEQVIAMFLRLEERGYLVYDAEKKIAYPNKKIYQLYDIVKTNADHDVIKIESVTSKNVPNMQLDIATGDLIVNGVKQVILSDAKNVDIVPDDNMIVVKKNLDISFNGKMMAGLFEFYTHEAFFNYSDFAIEIPKTDSMSFFVKRRADDPDKTLSDYVRITNVISEVSGVIYIDETNNKSSRDDNPQYPIFDCENESNVKFRDSKFVLSPFHIDSLFTFSTANFSLAGYFHSNDFEDFEEDLYVMDDYSLGFEHYTGEDGMVMFDGKTLFHNIIHVSDKDFYGIGTIEFLNSTVESERIDFYKDSLHCQNGNFKLISANVPLPHATADSADIRMSGKNNQLFIKSLQQKMTLYDKYSFDGTLRLEPTNLYGDGLFDMDIANVKSGYFNFQPTMFVADSSEFAAVYADGSKAFIASNYKTNYDFNTRIGSYTKLGVNGRVTFPLNEFYSTSESAIWNVDYETLLLSGDSDDKLVSINQKQNSLTFRSSDMSFNMKEQLITANKVDTIHVADAAVITSDGIISIGKNAEIQHVTNCIIIADTILKTHKFYDAEVEILGRNSYHASGKHDFQDYNKKDIPLLFNDIYVDSLGVTKAACTIGEYDNFLVGRDLLYKGEILLEANRTDFEFDGCFMLISECISDFQWFKSKLIFDPDNISIPLNDDTFDYRSGMFYDTLNKEFFVAFLSDNLIYEADKPICPITGELSFDDENQCFRISTMSLQADSCFIIGDGNIDFGINNSFVQLSSDGRFFYDINMDEIKTVTNLTLDFKFDDHLLDEITDNILSVNDTLKRKSIRDKHNFSIENLKMKWVSSLHCFINEGPIHLKSILKDEIDMNLNGYILLNYNDNPSLTFYLEYADSQYVYFYYKDGLLTSVSTDNDYINHLMEIKEKQRHFINRKTREEYEFVIGDFSEVNNFLQMVDYLKGRL